MSAVKFVKEGEEDGWNYPMREGWYFYGEDDGATMYGPYKDKETAENALIKYSKNLDRSELEYINYLESQENRDVDG